MGHRSFRELGEDMDVQWRSHGHSLVSEYSWILMTVIRD